jgi:hypothetical protein
MEKIDELKTLIKTELDLCDVKKTPTVCAISSTPEEYEDLEKMIIEKIKTEGLSIGQAIVEVEKEYNINLLND